MKEAASRKVLQADFPGVATRLREEPKSRQQFEAPQKLLHPLALRGFPKDPETGVKGDGEANEDPVTGSLYSIVAKVGPTSVL
ncbi:hypothetical protein KM043_013491 [Ampulex compressa]|nr:hypothetical protein KM043_013491 [Ampulex compressa]